MAEKVTWKTLIEKVKESEESAVDIHDRMKHVAYRRRLLEKFYGEFNAKKMINKAAQRLNSEDRVFTLSASSELNLSISSGLDQARLAIYIKMQYKGSFPVLTIGKPINRLTLTNLKKRVRRTRVWKTLKNW